MRFSKSLFVAFAGLGLFACSNEDVTTGSALTTGTGMVEVKIVSPSNDFARSAVDASQNGTVKVKGDITVKLTYGSNQTKEEILKDGETAVKFWEITNPTKIEAYTNDGEKVVETTSINNLTKPAMQAMPEAIPAYGQTTDIKLAGKTDVNQGKTYEMYQATVAMEIPVARLEVSGIKHVTHAEGTCKFSELTIDGVYLDKIYETKGSESATDYVYPAGDAGIAPILWEAITAPNNFLEISAQWPALVEGQDANQQAYAFNFYPGETMPVLKIYFAEAKATDSQNPVSKPRYAVIKSYNNDESFKFKAGYIYRLTDVQLKDENIIGDEEGNTLFGVDVTVTEAQWTVADITGQWIE